MLEAAWEFWCAVDFGPGIYHGVWGLASAALEVVNYCVDGCSSG